MTHEELCALGLSVVHIEAQAVEALATRINADFARACRILLNTSERIVVMGMGKSSYIGGKIAATLASTGSPAFFVHPGEASHGDLGMITAKDTVIAVSHSGETPELLAILPLIKHLKIPLVTLTGKPGSTLAEAADVNLDVSVKEEACPLGLAPTSSTTAALVMGDALAVALLKAKGFTAVDFARSHPGGRLGKRLLLQVGDLMRAGKDVPKVDMTACVTDALIEISQKGLGVTTVIDIQGKLAGIFTDGDLRRMLNKNLDIRTTCIKDVMSPNPKVVKKNLLAVEALQLMEDHRILILIITDETRVPIGILQMYDLLRAGVA